MQPWGCNFIKKETLAKVFSCEFCEISKNTFLRNTSGRLLLQFRKLSRFLTLHHIFSNNSKNTNQRDIWLTGTDHFISKLSKNVQFKKDIHLFFSIFQKICNKAKVQRSYYGWTGCVFFNPLLRNVVKWSDTILKSCSKCCKIFKVCLTILRHYEVKG